MRITVTIHGHRLTASQPYDGADHVLVRARCPHGCAPVVVLGRELPLKIKGCNTTHDHDTHRGDAHALCCGKRVGAIEVRVSTIFGIDEDARVLNGPWKVY